MEQTETGSELALADMMRDPVAAAKLAKAIEIVRLHVEQDLTIEDACAKVGLSRATYYRWTKDGVFEPILQAWMAPVVHTIQSEIIQGLPQVVRRRLAVAKGQVDKATQMDEQMAAQWLWRIADPILKSISAGPGPEGRAAADEAQKFLESTPEWLSPGEKIIKTTTEVVERQLSPAELIDVTPVQDLSAPDVLEPWTPSAEQSPELDSVSVTLPAEGLVCAVPEHETQSGTQVSG